MHFITDAVYAGDYKLSLLFNDLESRIVDLEPYLDGPIFEPLKELSYFRSFELNRDIDTVVWPNGADFSPDFLYSIGVPVGKAAVAAIKDVRS
jgi:hypothetical protein